MSGGDPMPFELDAREILRYLNNLGIRNISGAALKDFITDLKKLILYDLHFTSSSDETEVIGPERLHSASTFCSRLRSRKRDQPVASCRRECVRRVDVPVRNAVSAPTLRDQVQAPQRRACSCTRIETGQRIEMPKRKVLTASTNSNLIKVPIRPPQKKTDPVSLYHYYLTMWDKYKCNVPGENSWAELRWAIRQKLAGEVHKPVTKKIIQPTGRELEKRRQGWVE